MEFHEFIQSPFFRWGILPFLIVLARVVDVSLGTLRVIFISRGMKWLAPLVGFFEVLIWLLAIGQIMKNLSNVMCYLAYAGGFALGTYAGIALVNKLSLGMVLIQVITKVDATALVEFLKSENFGVTSINAEGGTGKVKVIYSVVKRQDLPRVIEIIKSFNPQAFYTVGDVSFVSEGIFPARDAWYRRYYNHLLRFNRKGK